jgi:2-phospho-L-lactate transferase/gluconeogenesis factor (CofD/UPF0052 family)
MYNIVLFSGGRGANNIIPSFIGNKEFSLSIIINAYDDGLSTGKLREFIPGFLGPSDIRKNIVRTMPEDDDSLKALKSLMEYRLPLNCDFEVGDSALKYLSGVPVNDVFEFKTFVDKLDKNVFTEITSYFSTFHDFFLYKLKHFHDYVFDFSDMSLGNIILAGCFIKNNNDFNLSIKTISSLFHSQAQILNISQGENYILCGLMTNGVYLPRESVIVNGGASGSVIEDIFLLPDYLSANDEKRLNSLKNNEERLSFLKEREVLPNINPDVLTCLAKADMIIYAPGTQHSSLYPTYLTQNLAKAIAKNKKAIKLFITNILRDNDIVYETVYTIISKFLYYANLKGRYKPRIKLEKLANDYFIQKYFESLSPKAVYIPYDNFDQKLNLEMPFVLRDWRDENKNHSIDLIHEELMKLINPK